MKKFVFSIMAFVLAHTVFATTEIRLAGFGGTDSSILNRLLKEVVQPDLEKHDITVKYQAVEGEYAQYILNALSAGTAPDLFYIDVFWSQTAIKSNKVASLNKVVGGDVKEALIPSLLNSFSSKGEVYGIAKDFNTLAVEFNRDIFLDAGVEVPNSEDTWESLEKKLVSVQSALKDDKVYGVCVVPDFARFGAFAFSTGWKMFNDQGRTVLDENYRRAFEWYTSLVKNGAGVLAQDVGQGWTGGCFGTEQAAISWEGAWMGGFLRDQAPNLDYGTTMMPKDPVTKNRGNFIFTVSWSMAEDSSNKEAAGRVIEALTSEKAQQWILEQGLALPSRAKLVNNPYFKKDGREPELNRIVFEGASDGHVYSYEFNGHGDSWKQIINTSLSSVLLGESDVDTAIKTAQDALDRLTGHM